MSITKHKQAKLIKLINAILKSMALYRSVVILPPETFGIDGTVELPAEIEIYGEEVKNEHN